MPLEMFSDLGAKRKFAEYKKTPNSESFREQGLNVQRPIPKKTKFRYAGFNIGSSGTGG